jgi:hypothetical protein
MRKSLAYYHYKSPVLEERIGTVAFDQLETGGTNLVEPYHLEEGEVVTRFP